MRCRPLLTILSVVVLLAFVLNWLISSIQNISMYTCTIPFEGKDPMVYGYLCAVDRCVYELFEEIQYDKFEVMWRKIPESMNWCATNAQMSVVKFTSKREIQMFKVNNMLERKKRTAETCTAVVISFDDDSSLRDLNLERILRPCQLHHVVFSSARVQGLANVLKAISPIIDILIVGPSKSSSYLLFQQFLGEYNDYLPTICQVNFAHTLPRTREGDGFMESMQKLRFDTKYLLMGASKDRTDMHLNLFFENMDSKYCRERFRYYQVRERKRGHRCGLEAKEEEYCSNRPRRRLPASDKKIEVFGQVVRPVN